ncbi:MAG: DivIVA domain-containing protein, partial [Lachnospiraceae bacterium]|nr:DivIVA domain-containing protein [Lachnospiraceae bacterium]
MLTPVEIQAKTFKSGGLGYDKKDVESFMREVTRSYEILYRENMELKDKVAVLNEGIQYYKSIEKTLQKALVLAEKTAETTKEA